jgi:hypothetical protein
LRARDAMASARCGHTNRWKLSSTQKNFVNRSGYSVTAKRMKYSG